MFTGKRAYKRKRKLIRLDLQLKIVFTMLFVTSLVLLINFQLNLTGLWSLSSRFMDSQDTGALLRAFRSSTIQKFLLSVGMAVPLAASVGVLYSFKFCGPIYRFKEYFRSLRDGRWDERCRLRRGDDLHDVCDMINEAVEPMRSRVQRDHDFFREVKTFLDANAALLEKADAEHLEKLRREIEAEAISYRNRFRPEAVSIVAPSENAAAVAGESSSEGETSGVSSFQEDTGEKESETPETPEKSECEKQEQELERQS